MASAEQYADWIVKNPDKKGTPEFDTVAAAYRAAREQAPAAVQAGSAIRDIPRQVGLTARYGIEGLGNLANMATEPLRLAVNPALRAAGLPGASSTGRGATALADWIGLPSPGTPNERVIGDATRTLASGIGMGAGLSRAAAEAGPGIARTVMQNMAARPMAQGVGAASAGAAGGSVREAGGGPWEQFGAAVLGGVAGGASANALSNVGQSVVRGVKSALTPKATEMARADQQITMVLERAGIDWTQVPERIKQGMRSDVAQALNTGQPLNGDALRRLLVFRRTDTTPTVGQLTQDPGMITREANLAKTAANSTDPSLQTLPALANRNVQTLLSQLDEAGAGRAGTASETAMRGINSLDSNISAARGNIDRLYQGARDTQGRSLPLEGGTFTRRASELLDEAMAGGALPKDVQNRLNQIAKGEYPLTVASAEDLKRVIGQLQRGSNEGSTRYALGLVRQALDETPLQNSQRVNPGNLPAAPGTVPPSVAAGEESIAAFNAARFANRAFMQRLEANPALRAVHDGVEPDQFMQRYVIGKQATAADVRALRGELSPEAVSAFRDYVTRHLRDAATNNTDDIAKFSSAAYRKAFADLEDKLPAFFSREEIQKLRDIGDAAKYMQAQPAGSAVNNSNSGALLLGRGTDLLQALAQRAPLGLKDTLSGTIQGVQQRQVMAPKNALMLPQAAQQSGVPVNPLLAGTVLVPEQPRKDNRRN